MTANTNNTMAAVNDHNTMLMEPNSGVVQSLASWYADYLRMDPQMWGGEDFEDAELIPVMWNEDDECWEEAA